MNNILRIINLVTQNYIKLIMQRYRNLLPEELAADPSFRRWILKGDEEDHAFWLEWVESNPDKLDLVDKARRLLEVTSNTFNKITDEEVANEIYRLSHSIGEQRGKRFFNGFTFRSFWYSIAASVLIAITAGLWYQKSKSTLSHNSNEVYHELLSEIKEPLLIEKNLSDKPKLVQLHDGSSVLLQPKSQITFPSTFTKSKREVFLTGEAFFEVAKNPEQPFYVYAGPLATKVLGTSFKVSAFANETEVKVVVKTGKVSVFPMTAESVSKQHLDESKLEGMILTPNQQIVFGTDNLKLTRSLISDPKVLELPIQTQSFVFKGTPVKEVFETLEKSYGVKIVFDPEIMSNCYLTASLSDEPLFEKLNLICKTIGAQYQQMDANIIIESKGCQYAP